MLRFRVAALLPFLPFLLSGCSTVLESVRAEVKEDLTTSLQLLLTDKKDVESLLTGWFQECGATVETFPRYDDKDKMRLQVQQEFRNPDELEPRLTCGIFADIGVRATLDTRDSVLSKTVSVSLSFSVPYKSDPKVLPAGLQLTLPGSISHIEDRSKSSTFRIETLKTGESRILVKLVQEQSKLKARQEEIDRIEARCEPATIGVKCKDEADNVKLRSLKESGVAIYVEATKSKIDLATAIAAFGFLLGSGVLLEVVKRLRARR